MSGEPFLINGPALGVPKRRFCFLFFFLISLSFTRHLCFLCFIGCFHSLFRFTLSLSFAHRLFHFTLSLFRFAHSLSFAILARLFTYLHFFYGTPRNLFCRFYSFFLLSFHLNSFHLLTLHLFFDLCRLHHNILSCLILFSRVLLCRSLLAVFS